MNKRWRCYYVFGWDDKYVSRGLESWIETSATDPSREDVICELVDAAPAPVVVDVPLMPESKKVEPMANTGGKEEDKSSGQTGWTSQVKASLAPGSAVGSGGPGAGSIGPVTPDVKLRDGKGTEVNVLPGAWSGVVTVDVASQGKEALAEYQKVMKSENRESVADFLSRSWKWILLALAAAYAAKKGGLF